MPSVTIEGPEIKDIEKKRQLVKRITEVIFDIYGIAKEHIIVLIRENSKENVGAGGQLIADKHKNMT